MPFTEAFIDEVQRHASLCFTGIVRMTAEDVKVGHYILPKGTQILPFYYDVMRDENYWSEDSFKFKPERFLNETGEKITLDRCVPFGIGKRNCLAKNYAMSLVSKFMKLYVYMN